MSDPTPPGEEPRTVFMPMAEGGSAESAGPATSGPADGPGEVTGDEARTIFAPLSEGSSGARAHPVASPPSREPTHGFQTNFAPREVGQGIQVGDVLNHIFEVKRFIARGGMGEVFEGANVNSDERVAIKVMLPSLAADPNVIAMFRKEARTLTRLQHEALVQYRVLAQEPQLGVLYIVTEYVDGDNLADVLGKQRPTPAELVALLRRLASGLRVAHQLGAIHRDMSPDNVLLEGGELGHARIIDFGIAKDLDPGSKTIVGDGFAGKLNYVAPEQLGDFGREIGPWTDVYSLALVILAVALGKNVPMGGTLVDAVDKRRAGPDLSVAPDALRPVLARMLAPNPADRLRSMDEVLTALDGVRTGPPVAPPPNRKTGLLIGAGVGLVALAGVAALTLTRGGDGGRPGEANGAATPVAVDQVAAVRATIDSTLPSVGCTWLSIARVEKAGGRIAVALTGVAGNPGKAQQDVSEALAQRKIANADLDFEAVSPITQSGCAALDAYRQIRSTEGQRLSVAQHKFEMRMQGPKESYAGRVAANSLLTIAPGDAKTDFALVGVEPSGVINELIPSRAALEAAVKPDGRPVGKIGENRYSLSLDLDHEGWSGVLMLTGKGPFDPALLAPGLGARGPEWLNRFVSTAAANGWQADMVWFKSVDEVREGEAPPAASPSPVPAAGQPAPSRP